MSINAPWALALAVVTLPVMATYFHRTRNTPLRVPSAILFRVIAGPSAPSRRALARPRHLVSLLLVLLALLALLAARLDLQPDRERPLDTIVVLDISASMGATGPDDARTRLDHAVDRLGDAVDRLGRRDRIALLTVADHAIVRVGLTEDHAQVLAVARGLTPGGTSEGAPAALRIADAMCRAHEHAAVVLLSDGVGVSAPRTRCPIEHVRVGQRGPNVGLSALSVREADALGLAEIYLAVTSDREAPSSEVEVELRLDEQLVEVVPLDLPAEGEVKRLLQVPLPPGRQVRAQLRGVTTDRLDVDDVAWAPRRIGGRVRALLVTESRLSFTAEALRLHPRVDLSLIGPHDATPEGSFDLVVLEAERDAAALPSASHIVALGAPATSLGITVAKPQVTDAQIVRWSFDAPVFRFVSFDEVQVPKTAILALAEGQTSLIDSDQGPIAVAAHADGQDRIAFGFLPHETDFVLRVGFVNLVANLVEWATPARAPAAGAAAESFATPAVESRVDPPPRIPGTVSGDFSGPPRADMFIGRLLVALAAFLLVIEWLLPALALGLRRLGSRVRARRTSRSSPESP